jgi:hypothetical protein
MAEVKIVFMLGGCSLESDTMQPSGMLIIYFFLFVVIICINSYFYLTLHVFIPPSVYKSFYLAGCTLLNIDWMKSLFKKTHQVSNNRRKREKYTKSNEEAKN